MSEGTDQVQSDRDDTGSGPSHPSDFDRRHRAKRFNEQLKSAYGFLNTLAAAVIVTGWIAPAIRSETLPFGLDTPILVIGGFGIHILGQAMLRVFMRREE